MPSVPLAAYVEAFDFHSAESSQPGGQERCLPNGQVALVINLAHDSLRVANRQATKEFQSFRGSVLHGAFSEFSVIDTTTMTTTVSICFKPGGTQPFVSIPIRELTNQVIDPTDIFGSDIAYLREQLLATHTRIAMVDILERFLLSRLAGTREVHPAVAFALASFHAENEQRAISDVTAQLGMSAKRFIHVFEDATGLTPKTFCRVLRFQEALRRIENAQHICWTDLALSCGYFDQAHFIHDFRTFSGLTPRAYLAQRGPHHNHIPQSS